MNTALLEELVRKKAENLRTEGLSLSEALDRAGDEILDCLVGSRSHGSRFCLRMWLQGAKKRLSPDQIKESKLSEDDKRSYMIKCVINPHVMDRPGVMI